MKQLFRSPVFLVALTVFIDFTGFGLVIPLLPFYAEKLGANAVEVGLLLTLYAVAQFMFTPALGALSDRYGRRPIILASLIVEALSLVLTALAGSLGLLLFARFLGGLGASNIGSAQAVVADVTPPDKRARGMGAIGAAIGLGFVVGPALGGVLARAGVAVPFWLAAALAVLNAALVFVLLPETRRHHAQSSSGRPVGADTRPGIAVLFGGWQRAATSPLIERLIVVNLCYMLAFTAMEAVLPLFTQHFFGWRAEQNGYLFTYVGVLVVVVQGGLVGRLARRIGERTLLLGGLLALAAGLALLAFGSSLAVLLVAVGIVSIGDGAVAPSVSALLSMASPPERQGEVLGISQGVGGLGRVLGPLVAGALFSGIGPGAPFLFGSALGSAALVLACIHAIPQRALAQESWNSTLATDVPAERKGRELSGSRR